MSTASDSASSKRGTFYRVKVEGSGLSYLTNSLKEVLDEVSLARTGQKIEIVKLSMTRGEAEADSTFIGKFAAT